MQSFQWYRYYKAKTQYVHFSSNITFGHNLIGSVTLHTMVWLDFKLNLIINVGMPVSLPEISHKKSSSLLFNGKTQYITRNVKVRSHFTVLLQMCLYSYHFSSLDVVCIVSVLLLSVKTLLHRIHHYQYRIFGPVRRCIHCQISSNFFAKQMNFQKIALMQKI